MLVQDFEPFKEKRQVHFYFLGFPSYASLGIGEGNRIRRVRC